MSIPVLSATNVPNIKRDPGGNYWVDITVKGRRRRKRCENLRHAKALLANVSVLFPQDRSTPVQRLSDLAAHYRAEDEMRNVDHANHATMEATLVRILGDPPFHTITMGDIVRYQLARTQEGLSPARINHETVRLQRLLEQATRDGMLDRNPVARHQKLPEPPGRLRWMSTDEEAIIRPHMSKADWRLVEIAFRSGMRQREQFSAKLDQIRWDANVIHLPATKNGEARDIPMGKRLRVAIEEQWRLGQAVAYVWELGLQAIGPLRVQPWRLAEYVAGDREIADLALRRYPLPEGGEKGRQVQLEQIRSNFAPEEYSPGEWLCLNPKTLTRWDGNSFYKYRWLPACRAAGVTSLCWHEAGRHTFCSRLAIRGVPLRTIQKLAGHKSITTTERYAKLSRDHLHTAVEVLDED